MFYPDSSFANLTRATGYLIQGNTPVAFGTGVSWSMLSASEGSSSKREWFWQEAKAPFPESSPPRSNAKEASTSGGEAAAPHIAAPGSRVGGKCHCPHQVGAGSLPLSLVFVW